jgi:ABC-type transport system involved in cytochrome bd biosynthesis fused ATPase/permease subunit
VDGAWLRNQESWARAAAYVPQRLSLLNLSVAQYLAMGRDVPKTAMVTALETIGASWAVPSLDIELGFETGAGTQISPGQRLQLAIARVLLRPEAQLVVLDEPSAGLAEWHVDQLTKTIRTHLADRLVVMATHREDLVDQADWVLWLDHGRLRQEGSPETCRRDEGFRRFWGSDPQADG